MELFFFAFFAAASIAGALSLVLQRNPIYSALSLIVVIASIGGLFLMMHSALLAVLQMIIYAGAVMTLFVFVIMMVDIRDEAVPRPGVQTKLAIVTLILIGGAVIWGISLSTFPFPAQTSDFSVHAFSTHLFTEYLFPFEAISVLIVSAVIGALYIARKEDA